LRPYYLVPTRREVANGQSAAYGRLSHDCRQQPFPLLNQREVRKWRSGQARQVCRKLSVGHHRRRLMPRLSERFVSRPRSPQMKSRNSRCLALLRSGCANRADDAAPKPRRANTVQNAGEAVLLRNWSHSSHLEGRARLSGRALTGCYAH